MPLDDLSHLGELAEYQRAVPHFYNLFQHFGQSLQLAGATGDAGVVPEKLRGMVAYLLQLGESSKHRPSSLDALRTLQSPFSLLQRRGVQGRLFAG